jgi:hypothetical protein
MVPALSAEPAAAPRLGFIYVSNGFIQEQWKPARLGPISDLPTILKPLEPVKEYLNVLSGLAHLQANNLGDGTGDHPRSSAAWLTGVHAYDRTRPGVEVKLATSADQLAARHIGRGTQLPSLELSVDFSPGGTCDSGDCFYINSISWRNESTPNPTESHPRIVFERLFGDGGSAARRTALMKDTGSILDSVQQEAARLAKTLGPGDRSKLTGYLDSVREIEQRIQSTEQRGAQSIELPVRPIDIPDSFEEHTKLMFDLQTLAFRADMTRVFTMIMAREASSRTFPNIGVPEQHHAVSHHRNDPELASKKAKIDRHHVELLGYFLEKLRATPDGNGTLLDNSLIVYGGGMGDGNLHLHTDLPCLLAGKLGGKFKIRGHLEYPQNTPMTNLLLTVLANAGIPDEKLGDSTGKLHPDYLCVG